MPSSITHQLIAEEAATAFPPLAKEAIACAPDEFFLGAQGPDVFFFYRIGNRSEYNLGKFLHRNRVYDVFELFLSVLRGEDGAPTLDDDARKHALSYALGYLCHYCADSAFHPFVYRYLEENRSGKREHQLMENDWDVYFLRERTGKSAEDYVFPFSASEIVKDGTVARIYHYLGEKFGREEVTKSRFDRGVKNFERYLRFFHGDCYSSQRGWDRFERFFRAKKLLSCLYPREAPDPRYLGGDDFREYSEGRGGNADELFAFAVNECVRLSKLFFAALDGAPLPREEFGNGLLTGKPVD